MKPLIYRWLTKKESWKRKKMLRRLIDDALALSSANPDMRYALVVSEDVSSCFSGYQRLSSEVDSVMAEYTRQGWHIQYSDTNDIIIWLKRPSLGDMETIVPAPKNAFYPYDNAN